MKLSQLNKNRIPLALVCVSPLLAPYASAAPVAKLKNNAAPKPKATTIVPPKAVATPTGSTPGGTNKSGVRDGELRLDGKITGLLGDGVWQMQAASWTSPRDVATDFDEPKNKGVQLTEDVYIHSQGSSQKIELNAIKLGSRIAVIGKNQPDGTLLAREVILLSGTGNSIRGGTVVINARVGELIDQGRAARDGGQTSKALSLFNQALGAAQGALDTTGEGLVLRDMALVYSELGQDQKAIDAYTRSAAISHEKGEGEASAYNGLGVVYMHMGKAFNAVKALEKADELSKDGDPKTRVIYLDNLASAYSNAARDDEAYLTLQRLEPLQEAVGQTDDATETLTTLAFLSTIRSPDSARDYLNKATPRIPQVKDQKTRAMLLSRAARTLWRLDDKEAAKVQFEAAAQLYDELGDTKNAETVRSITQSLEKATADPEEAADMKRRLDEAKKMLAEGAQDDPDDGEAAPDGEGTGEAPPVAIAQPAT